MARRKVTFVYETGRPLHGPIAQMMPNLENHVRCLGGVDPSSVTVEDLPDPPRVDAYTVVLETREGLERPSADEVRRLLREGLSTDWGGTKVTDVWWRDPHDG